jgi:dTDP-4-amino-4,6-dideoxygalactose transaminase
MRIPLVDLKKQYQDIKEEILAEIGQALDGMQLFLGKNVQAIEASFAAYCGTEFGIGVGSGTDGLHVALRACGIGAGDEVITVANTFIATAEAIILAGARPVFVDIDPVTQNIDTAQIENAITHRTKAILPVHLFGQTADMEPIKRLAWDHNLKIIEDACQAHGAEYQGQRAGSLGDVGCFSFYFTKNLGAYGESGIITTSDPEIARRCRMIRDHGQSSKYYHDMIGFNGRLDEVQAAILKVKLPYLNKWIEERRALSRLYDSYLPASVIKPQEMPGAKHVYYVYVIRTPDRDELRAWLDGKGIGTGIHYPVPIHRQEAWFASGGENVSLPVTEKITGEILSLPMYPELSEEEVKYICECVSEFCESRLGAAT